MRTILQQTISSTHLDLQGEKMDIDLLKEFADLINSSGRFPIGQHHDMNLPYTGYMENAIVVEDIKKPGEYLLKADIYTDCEDLGTLFRGFSFSINVGIRSNAEEPHFGVYLPFPHYNSIDNINKILEIEAPIKAGKWVKKSDDPNTTVLVVTFIVLLLGPFWQQVYDSKIAPHMSKILESKNIDKSLKRDFVVQVEDASNQTFSIYFSSKINDIRSLDPYIIKKGIQKVTDYIEQNEKARVIGLSQVRMLYNSNKSYDLFSITFRNGDFLNI